MTTTAITTATATAVATTAGDTGALLAPTVRLGATKSSHRWNELPGGFDRLNLRALFASGNDWGIPDLPAATFVPARLVAYNDRRACTLAATAAQDTTGNTAGAAVHFFLDDYRFETVWSKPERGLSRCCSVGAALTPDFSLWSNMPPVMQLWQVYRSRWCGAWLLHNGIPVVPTISWSTPDSYPFAFAGIPAGSVVAVSTVGTRRNPEARALFDAGFTAMAERLRPSTVLVYGKPPTEHAHTSAATVGAVVRCYPSRWDTRKGGDR